MPLGEKSEFISLMHSRFYIIVYLSLWGVCDRMIVCVCIVYLPSSLPWVISLLALTTWCLNCVCVFDTLFIFRRLRGTDLFFFYRLGVPSLSYYYSPVGWRPNCMNERCPELSNLTFCFSSLQLAKPARTQTCHDVQRKHWFLYWVPGFVSRYIGLTGCLLRTYALKHLCQSRQGRINPQHCFVL